MEKGKNAPPPGCSEPVGTLRRRPSLALLVQTRKGIHHTVMPRGRLCKTLHRTQGSCMGPVETRETLHTKAMRGSMQKLLPGYCGD